MTQLKNQRKLKTLKLNFELRLILLIKTISILFNKNTTK